MKTLKSEPNELHSISSSENIASPRFHVVSFVCKYLVKCAKSRNVPGAVFPLLLMFFQNISIFWLKNISCTRYNMLLLTEKKMCVTIRDSVIALVAII